MGGHIKYRNLGPDLKWQLDTAGFAPGVAAQKSMVYYSSSAAPYAYWSKRATEIDQLYSSIQTAHDATTSARNDVVFLTPEGHVLTSTLTWSNYDTHLVGMDGGRPAMFQRPRMNLSGNFTPVVTHSGWNCTWANLRMAHGAGAATNLVGLNLTGHYNNFTNFHLYSPGTATEGDVDSDTLYSMGLAGGNNYFENCAFGVDTIARSAANCVVKIMTSGVCNFFKDCTFHMLVDATSPYFIYVASGSGVQNRYTYFDNCAFIAYSTGWATSPTVAIKYQYSGAGHRLLFNNSCFFGVTDLIADGYEDNCQFFSPTVTAGTGVGLPHVPQT